jgi:hypothetical protein
MALERLLSFPIADYNIDTRCLSLNAGVAKIRDGRYPSDYVNLIRRANARWTWSDQTLQ